MKNGIRNALSFFYPSLMRIFRLKSVDQNVEDFMFSIVTKTLEHREQNNISRKDFFQFLVQLRNTGAIQQDGDWDTLIANEGAKKELSIAECAAQVFVFFLAGFETSSTTMAYSLYELARNPDCMQRVHLEIDLVLSKYNGELSYEAIGEMKYLDLCIAETLRMYPPVPMLNRECTMEYKIPGTDSIIPKGTSIIIPLYALHHDDQFYTNPEQFDPNRFSAENLVDKTPVNMPYIPFGDGPRNCIGMRLGRMQTKLGLITVLQDYTWSLAGNTKKPLVMSAKSVVLMPLDGLELRVTKRY